MPLIDITQPKVIKFLNESYVKEATLRMAWLRKNKEIIAETVKLNREFTNNEQSDIIENTFLAGMAAMRRDHETSTRNRRVKVDRDGKCLPVIKDLVKGHSIVDVGLGTVEEDPRLGRPDNSLDPDPIMRPVDAKLTAVITRPEGEGRLPYLKERVKVFPEKRYYFPECVNWDYGWRMKDNLRKPDVRRGRRCVLTNSFKANRVGPQPDPVHYNSSVIPGVQKCLSV